MSQFLTSPAAAVVGIVVCAMALLVGGYVLLAPGAARLPEHRRRPAEPSAGSAGALSGAAAGLSGSIEKLLLRRRGGVAGATTALEDAGLTMRLQDLVLLVIVGDLVAALLGFVIGGPLLALLLAVLVPVGVKLAIGMLTKRRQDAFADQLEDSLQLMASSLRAGHSLLQALDSVSHEAEEPTSQEFARIINETRVGRELGHTLDETAQRMGSQDFIWVAQAIAINREVGGNLAEVLDGVGHTIRERNQIRRQCKALAAEGKLSAIILMALPFGILAFLSVANPGYVAAFTESLMGYGMLAVGVVLLVIGGLWLRKVVQITF